MKIHRSTLFGLLVISGVAVLIWAICFAAHVVATESPIPVVSSETEKSERLVSDGCWRQLDGMVLMGIPFGVSVLDCSVTYTEPNVSGWTTSEHWGHKLIYKVCAATRSLEVYEPNCVTSESIHLLCQSGRVCEVMGHQWKLISPQGAENLICGLCGEVELSEFSLVNDSNDLPDDVNYQEFKVRVWGLLHDLREQIQEPKP